MSRQMVGGVREELNCGEEKYCGDRQRCSDWPTRFALVIITSYRLRSNSHHIKPSVAATTARCVDIIEPSERQFQVLIGVYHHTDGPPYLHLPSLYKILENNGTAASHRPTLGGELVLRISTPARAFASSCTSESSSSSDDKTITGGCFMASCGPDAGAGYIEGNAPGISRAGESSTTAVRAGESVQAALVSGKHKRDIQERCVPRAFVAPIWLCTRALGVFGARVGNSGTSWPVLHTPHTACGE